MRLLACSFETTPIPAGRLAPNVTGAQAQGAAVAAAARAERRRGHGGTAARAAARSAGSGGAGGRVERAAGGAGATGSGGRAAAAARSAAAAAAGGGAAALAHGSARSPAACGLPCDDGTLLHHRRALSGRRVQGRRSRRTARPRRRLQPAVCDPQRDEDAQPVPDGTAAARGSDLHPTGVCMRACASTAAAGRASAAAATSRVRPARLRRATSAAARTTARRAAAGTPATIDCRRARRRCKSELRAGRQLPDRLRRTPNACDTRVQPGSLCPHIDCSRHRRPATSSALAGSTCAIDCRTSRQLHRGRVRNRRAVRAQLRRQPQLRLHEMLRRRPAITPVKCADGGSRCPTCAPDPVTGRASPPAARATIAHARHEANRGYSSMGRRARSACACASCSRGAATSSCSRSTRARRKDPRRARRAARTAPTCRSCACPTTPRARPSRDREPQGARASTAAPRTASTPGWVYGLPELAPGQRAAIAAAARVATPAASRPASALLLRPLVDAGLLAADAPLTIHALSGYSGGGQSMIDRWESAGSSACARCPTRRPTRSTAATSTCPEMMRYGRLSREPQFVPAVGPFRCGMRVQIPLPAGAAGQGRHGRDRVRRAARALCGRALRDGAAARSARATRPSARSTRPLQRHATARAPRAAAPERPRAARRDPRQPRQGRGRRRRPEPEPDARPATKISRPRQ